MKSLLVLFTALCPLLSAWAQPNLLLIIADDCTYRDMEVYGGQAKTPHLNKLAGEGHEVHALLSGRTHVLAHATLSLHRDLSSEVGRVSEPHHGL
jgi:hypothetical protein